MGKKMGDGYQLDELLVHNPVFASLDVVDRAELARQAIRKQYRKGEWIVYHGDDWPYLFLVGDGLIHALKESSEGRSLIVLTLTEGEVFWGMSFFVDDVTMPVLLQAQADSTIYLWSREDMMPWLLGNGRISWELSRLMIQRMQRASEIVEELAFQPVRGRLARLLLGHFGEAVDEFVARDLTLDEMAARVGTKREMVCRLLYQFAEEGVIEINRTEFMITDRDLLQRYADSAKS
ncbi:MAG: Crp/Fnr family transcriptional regulator [Ardenticatenaceae bacterium]|nr:Crp/Fnr family transcriptional regulator [Ardenticatenaceae bacterium]